MLHLTHRIDAIARDLIRRVPRLAHIDMDRVLVFARVGRAGARGPLATCHCLGLPPSEAGYYFWRSSSGVLLRRSPYFVSRHPDVVIRGRRLGHLLSFSLPRFCNQSLDRQPKQRYYRRTEPWLAKLDTIVHELYHIDPDGPGIRVNDDGTRQAGIHGEAFFQRVAEMVEAYLASEPSVELLSWLQHDFRSLQRAHGGVAATVFRTFPAYPQPFADLMDPQPKEPEVPVVPLTAARRRVRFDERDLEVRLFEPDGRTTRLPTRPMWVDEPAAVAA